VWLASSRTAGQPQFERAFSSGFSGAKQMPSIIDRMPIDKTKAFHIGIVRKVIFRDDSKPFCILALTDERTVKGGFLAEQFENNNVWRFHGRWQDDAARGPHFAADTVTLESVRGEFGLVEYLERLSLPITRAQIRLIYKEYGDNTFSTLREKPDEVSQTAKNWEKRHHIDIETAREIAEMLKEEKDTANAKQELFTLFQRRGFNSKTVERCIKKWGKNAPAIIRQNPFVLMELPSCGFRRCDKLYHELGHDPTGMKRQVACLAWVLAQDRTGNTWQLVDDVEARFLCEIPDGDVIGAIKYGLEVRALDKLRDAEDNLYLARYRDSMAEQTIAAAIRSLNQAEPHWPIESVPISQAEGDGLPSSHQVEQLRVAVQKPVGMFLGGPGTGKTHSLAYLLRELVERIGSDRIAAIAPTGKAAQRMRESLARCEVDLHTSTIHSFLKLSIDEEEGTDGPDVGKCEAEFIIVDEVSMCDTSLMARLFRSLPRGTHVLLIGDPHQLPPVGHGAPLRDFLAAGLSHGELTEVRRNAGCIVRACASIKSGESRWQATEVCERPDLNAADYPRNLVNVESESETDTMQVVDDILITLKSFDPVWQTQIVVGRNKGGMIARQEVNDRLQRLLNPNGRTCGNNPFRVNDKIICLKNQKLQTVSPNSLFGEMGESARIEAKNYHPNKENGQPVQVFVANGEMGRVIAISENQFVAQFAGKTELVRVPVGTKKNSYEDREEEGETTESGRGCQFDLAYAVTCHKLQGSESPICIVLADERANLIAGREWWYTAISRASKLCMLIGSPQTIAKQCMRQTLNRRKTFLKERIVEAMLPKPEPHQPEVSIDDAESPTHHESAA
jgi:exodeoxyribonuclease V alpha subunit